MSIVSTTTAMVNITVFAIFSTWIATGITSVVIAGDMAIAMDFSGITGATNGEATGRGFGDFAVTATVETAFTGDGTDHSTPQLTAKWSFTELYHHFAALVEAVIDSTLDCDIPKAYQ